MEQFDLIIVGGGPMGIATAIEANKKNLSHLILERGALVNSIYNFPKNMTFFSTSQKLEIGDVPFMSTLEKPTRSEALEYYRRVIEKWNLNIRLYEEVENMNKSEEIFSVRTTRSSYRAKSVVVATGFYCIPKYLNISGEDLAKVSHYYDEPHPYIGQKVAVIGAANSACQAALELFHKGVDVTMIIRSPEIKQTVKYWIKPNIENRIEEGSIKAYFNSSLIKIEDHKILIKTPDGEVELENDFVLAMTGYQPDYDFLSKIGIKNCDDEFITPKHNEHQETNIDGLYLAGVVCGGMKTNKFIIENSKIHAEAIIEHICSRKEIYSQ